MAVAGFAQYSMGLTMLSCSHDWVFPFLCCWQELGSTINVILHVNVKYWTCTDAHYGKPLFALLASHTRTSVQVPATLSHPAPPCRAWVLGSRKMILVSPCYLQHGSVVSSHLLASVWPALAVVVIWGEMSQQMGELSLSLCLSNKYTFIQKTHQPPLKYFQTTATN